MDDGPWALLGVCAMPCRAARTGGRAGCAARRLMTAPWRRAKFGLPNVMQASRRIAIIHSRRRDSTGGNCHDRTCWRDACRCAVPNSHRAATMKRPPPPPPPSSRAIALIGCLRGGAYCVQNTRVTLTLLRRGGVDQSGIPSFLSSSPPESIVNATSGQGGERRREGWSWTGFARL